MRTIYAVIAGLLAIPTAGLALEDFFGLPHQCGGDVAFGGIILLIIFTFPVTLGAMVYAGWVGFRFGKKGLLAVLAALAVTGALYGAESIFPGTPTYSNACRFDL